MKHFRDLVLSTKEPVLHNILWINPDEQDLDKYTVFMFEDGWKPLFGTSSAGTAYFDFVASNEQTNASGNVTTWTVTTNDTVIEIEEALNSEKSVYARITGIEDQHHRRIPTVLPLTQCINGFTTFSIYGRQEGYILEGSGREPGSVGWILRQVKLQPKLNFDTVPTEGSTNPVTSGGIYAALINKVDLDVLRGYVLQSVYDERMSMTPKMQRVEWIIKETEPYDIASNTTVCRWTQEKEDSGRTPEKRFTSLWWAVYNNYLTTDDSDQYRPKLIMMYGCPACYCTSNDLTIDGYQNATTIDLRFFNGKQVITYHLTKQMDEDDHVMILIETQVESISITQ